MKYSLFVGLTLTAVFLREPWVSTSSEAGATSQAPQSPASGLPSTAPAPSLWNGPSQGLATLVSNPEISCLIDLYPNERSVSLDYSHTVDPIRHEYVRGDGAYTAAFWPLRATWLRPSWDGSNPRFYVAGKAQRDDRTVIEEWTFEPPNIVTSGGSSSSISGGARTDVHRFYFEETAGRGLPQAIGRYRATGQQDELLVLFHDSRDIYRIRTTDGVAVLWARSSGTATPTVWLEPFLASEFWVTITDREHVTDGYAYVLGRKKPNYDASVPATLILWDQDKDGILDGSEMIDGNDWSARDYDSLDTWVE